jgi:hypothetical protein
MAKIPGVRQIVPGTGRLGPRRRDTRVVSSAMHRVFAVALVFAALVASCSKPADPAPVPAPRHEDRHDPAIAHPPLALTVAIDGAASTWTQDALDKVARFTGNARASDGEIRDAWSLRELTRALVGPTARVTSVTGDRGARSIDEAAWNDAAHTPVLHTTRRGTLKFRWADTAGAWGESEVRDVTRIEITR